MSRVRIERPRSSVVHWVLSRPVAVLLTLALALWPVLFPPHDVMSTALLMPVALLGVGVVERAMGSWRTAIVCLVGSVAVVLAGFAATWIELHLLVFLPVSESTTDVLSPASVIICTVMAGSCFLSALWRRRTRVLTTLAVVTLFLFSGSGSDMLSLLALPIGLAIGAALGGRSSSRLVRSSHHETRVLLAATVTIGAVGPVVATMFGSGSGLLSLYGFLSIDPVTVVDGRRCTFSSGAVACPAIFDTIDPAQPAAALIALLPVAVELIAAAGILAGRRAALWIAVALDLLLFVAMMTLLAVIEPSTVATIAAEASLDANVLAWQTLTGSIACALLPLAGALALVLLRGHVAVRSTRAARTRFTLFILGGAAAASAASLVGTVAASDLFTPSVDARTALLALPLRLAPPTLLPSDALTFVPTGGWADAVWYLPSALFWIIAVAASATLIFTASAVEGADEAQRARDVLERGGGSPVSFMSTWVGNTYWFDSDQDAAVAFRVRGGVAIALGGPFGPAHRDPGVIRRFVEHCGDQGWTPAFYSVDDASLPDYKQLGWLRLQVAEEAILHPARWSTEGKKWQDIRTAVNRAGRAGVRAHWTSWKALTLADRSQIVAMSETWVADRELPEMGFTLGGVDELDDPAVRLMLAVDEHGSIQAATSWLPAYGQDGVDGYTLDFMRRGPEAMNGVMEFLIAATAEEFKRTGIVGMSLSCAPLARSGTANAGTPRRIVDLMLERLGRSLEPAYGFASLLNFKRKFQPEFEPIWLLYPDSTRLPSIGMALLRCYVPHLTARQATRLLRTLRAGDTKFTT